MNVHKGLCAAPFARRPLAVVLALLAGAAYAAPQGGQIVGGNGSIHQQGQTTTIQQQTERLAINWQSFDIAADERVQFLQPSSQSIALNQVLGNNPSQILGRIDANGYVVLVNSRGILFSESATVNVGGLVASGLNLAVEDFMQGEWRFLADPDHAGFVINRGLIQASSNAVLLGRQVGNEGPQALIAAGLVQLAAADAAVLTFDADRRIGIRVEQAVLDNLQGADSAVHNSGGLRGREVLLDAAVAEDVFTRAVNNEGIVQARGIDTSGGVIRLSGRGGEVASSGTLDASAEAGSGGQVVVRGDTVIIDGEVNVAAAEGAGGTIRVSGERVALLDQARLDASGRDGGGSIHVGGGWQGQNPDIENSRISHVAAGARLDASATGNGDGGEVVVWSDGLTRFLGRIEARGGAESGDGGRVETSGAEQLIATGRVDVGASAGAAGLYLVDPADITIGSGTTDIGGDGDPFRPGTGVATSFLSVESLLDALEQGNVTVQTANQGASGAGAGTITIEAGIDLHVGDGHALTLRANQDILLLDDVQIADLTDGSASVDLVFRADRHIVFGEGSLVNSGGGSIVLDANENLGTAGNLQLAGSLLSGGGAITLRGIDLDNTGSIDAGTGNIAIFTGRGDRNSNNVLGSLSSSGSISVTGAGGNDHYRVSAPLGGGSMSVDGSSGSNRLYGSAGDDSFLLGAGSNQLSWLGIAFSNIQQVDAQGGNNSLTGTALSDAFALTGQAGDVLVRGINFSGLSEVQGGAGSNSLAGFGGETFGVTGTSALSVSGLAFTGLDSVAAAGGTLVSAQDGGSFALTGNAGELQHRGLAFSDLSAVETVSGVVQGSAVDETYVVDGDGRLGVAAMLFSDVAEVWAGAGSDDLLQGGAGNDSFQLVGSGELDHRGIRFRQIDRIDGGAGNNLVLGTADNDHFVLQVGSQRFSALDIDFSNIQQVGAQGGVNSLQGTDAGDHFSLTGASGEVVARGTTFANLTQVQGGAGSNSLTGSGSDTFTVSGGNVLSRDLVFSGLGSVDAAGGTLLSNVAGESFSLTGSAGELLYQGLLFQVPGLVSTVDGVVQGSAVDETYVVDGDGRLGVAAMLFSDVAEVWAGAGSDDLLQGGAGNDSFQLVGSGELDHRGIRFRQIDRVDGGAGNNLVLGTADNDHFVLQVGSQRFSALDIDFSNIQQVDAQGGVNSLQGTDAGDHFSLTGASGEVVARGTTFANLTQVQGGAGSNSLTGSGSDTFTVSGGNVLSRDLVFSGLGSVDAAGGTLLSNVAGESFSLTGSAGELLYQGLLFQAPGLVSTVDGVVLGSAADETYRVDGDGRLDVAGLLFDDIAEVLAGADSDDLLQGGAGDDVFRLTGASGELQYRDILFRQIDRVDGGDGSNTLMDSGALAFQLSATRELQVADLQFSALDQVELASGSTVLGRAQVDVFTVLGDGSLRVLDVRFDGAESIVGGGTANQLVTSGSDTLSLDAGRVLLRNMDFEGIAQVQAAAGDTLLGSAGADDFVLLASGGMVYLGLEFSGLGRVQAQGAGNRVIGSDAGDTYTLVDERSFDVAGTRFEAIDQILAGAGTDTVVGRIQNDVFSVSDLSQLLVLGMIFDGIEQVDAGTASSADQLLGSASDDLFELLGERSLRYRGIVFNELNSVAAGAGDNTLLGRPVDDTVTVTGSRQLEAAGLTFSGIDRVEGNAGSNLLLLPAGGANLQLGAESGSLQVADILFSAWQQVQASGDGNQLSGAPASGDWQLLGERALVVSGLTFSGIDMVSAAGSEAQVLAASSGSEFLLRASDAARVDGIEFSAVGGGFSGAAGDDRFALAAGFSGSLVVDAGGGSNTLVGSSADDLFLLLGSESLSYRGVSFSGIQQVEAGAGFNTVQAQVPDLSLTLQGSRTAAAAGVHFEQIDRFDFGTGSNTLITAGSGGEALIDGGNRVRALDLLVTGVATLQGGAGDDHFILAPGGSLSGGLFGGGGSNRLTTQGSANQWQILAGDQRVNGFAFSGFQELIDQGSGGFNLETDRGITFNSGRWIGFDAGEVTRLEFQVVPQLTVAAAAIQVNVLDLPGGNLDLTAAAGVTGGGLNAVNLRIQAGGDVQLSTAVDNADIVSGGGIALQQSGDIHLQRLLTAGGDIHVSGDSDIVVTRVGTGSRNTGSVTLESSLGSILVSAAGSGQINIEAGAITLEALQRIGVIDNPFFLSSATAPSISALEYVNPLLTPGTPEPIARGRRIASLTEVIASSGMRSAVQPYGVEIVAIDPAIFTALQPFTLVGEAIALPEDQRLD